MAYAGETPWHGLGVSVDHTLSPEEFRKAAGLDWEVKKITPVGIHNCTVGGVAHKVQVRAGDRKMLARVRKIDGKPDEVDYLSMVSDDWHINQNSEVFSFFDEFIQAGDMTMHTAGSLKNGRVVWALAKINDGFEIFGHDRVESYLLFSNPHEYGKSIDVRFTPIRVVCNNTLQLSLRTVSESSIRLHHRSAFNAEMVKETLGIAREQLSHYKETAEFLGSKRAQASSVSDYFKSIFPATTAKKRESGEMSRVAGIMAAALETQPGTEFAPGSWWQAFNAATFTIDHLAGRDQESRLYSAWYGGNRQKKIDALNKAVEFAQAA